MTQPSGPAGHPRGRRRPPGRYDEPGQGGGKLTAVVMAVLVLGLVAAVANTLWTRFGGERATAQVVDFQVLSDEVVRIDVQVTKPEGAAAYCLLRARGADGADDEAGELGQIEGRAHDGASSSRPPTVEFTASTVGPVRP